MLARSVSEAGGYVPVELPRVAVAADGTVAAVLETARAVIVELPSAVAFAQISVDPAALGCDVAWVGTPPRLLVLSRYAESSIVHLLDPHGPRMVAEIRIEVPMRLLSTVGASALAVGPQRTSVLIAGESQLAVYQFPTRTVPAVAGAAAGQLVVALANTIEEWDPQSRTPKRRVRLPRIASITAVGGSERLMWMTTQQEPRRIDVIPLVNRGQPKVHDLPEPIAHITGHPRSDLVACVGADTGRIYVIDLDHRMPRRVIEVDGGAGVAAVGLVIGRTLGVLAAQAQRPLVVMSLDSRDFEPAAGRAPDLAGVPARREHASTSTLVESSGGPAMPGMVSTPVEDTGGAAPGSVPGLVASAEEPAGPGEGSTTAPDAPAPVPDTWPEASAAEPVISPPASPAVQAVPATAERTPPLASVSPPRSPAAFAVPARSRPVAKLAAPRRWSWRDDVVAWSRAVTSGAAELDAPAAPAVAAVLARFDLSSVLGPVLVLLYGAHLCGQRGIAPFDVARVHDWAEALGHGELAQRGVAGYAGSRVALSPVILRVLDDLPPLTGNLVGEPGSVTLLGPCVVVAGDEPLADVAERYRSRVGGAILVARDEVDLAALVFEARACGAAPMLRTSVSSDAAPGEPAIYVVADTGVAERLGIPRLE